MVTFMIKSQPQPEWRMKQIDPSVFFSKDHQAVEKQLLPKLFLTKSRFL